VQASGRHEVELRVRIVEAAEQLEQLQSAARNLDATDGGLLEKTGFLQRDTVEQLLAHAQVNVSLSMA